MNVICISCLYILTFTIDYCGLALSQFLGLQNLEEIDGIIRRALGGTCLEDLSSRDVVFYAEGLIDHIALISSSYLQGDLTVLYLLAESQKLQNLPDCAERTLQRILSAFSSEDQLNTREMCHGTVQRDNVFCSLAYLWLLVASFATTFKCLQYVRKIGR